LEGFHGLSGKFQLPDEDLKIFAIFILLSKLGINIKEKCSFFVCDELVLVTLKIIIEVLQQF